MADCESLQGCPFFNDKMKDTEGLGALYKKRYCLGDNTRCARYILAKGKGKGAVPLDLYPNMIDRARELLAGA